MGLLLLFAFILIPVIELGILIEVGSNIGAWSTIGLVLLTAVAGSFLIRWQGFGLIGRIQSQMQNKTPPVQEMVDGAALLIAGMCLLTPGFVTDAFGFILLIPGLRVLIAKRIISRVKFQSAGFSMNENTGRMNAEHDDIIDIPAEDITDISTDSENNEPKQSPWNEK